MSTYRYRQINPGLDRLAFEVPVAVSEGTSSPQILKDLTTAAPLSVTEKADLDAFMLSKGYEYVSTDPVTTPAAAFATATTVEIEFYNNGTLVARRPKVNFTNPSAMSDDAINGRVDVTFPAGGGGGAPLSNALPQALGTSSAGVGTSTSRDDHVHAHGSLAGGSLHADVIAAGASGFMTGADKTKLDGVATSATNTPLTAAAPADVGTTAVGVATAAARADHVHAHGNQAGGGLHSAAVAGVSNGFMSAADKTKLDGVASSATNTPLTAAAPVDVNITAAEVGVSTDAARADHKHNIEVSTPVAIGSANAEGTSARVPRADHVHAHGDQAGGTLHSTASAGVSAGFMSAADKTKLDGVAASATNTPLSATAPVNVTKAAASAGVATEAARQDHKHDITTAAPSTVGTANSEGTATSLARSDHVHSHGAQTDGTLHAAAVAAGASGFMTGADKTKLDGIASGATATPLSSTAPVNVTKAAASAGVATDAARQDHKHDVTTAAPATLAAGGSNTEGTATSLARSDHVHALPAYGSAAGTICQGNDARLTDDRTASGLRTASGIVVINTAVAPTAGQVLKAISAVAAEWQADAGGAGGAPGGSSGQVQYNDGAGGFAGAGKLIVDASGYPNVGELDVGSPTAPATGATIFTRFRAGRRMLGQVGPAGIDYLFQPGLFNNKVGWWIPNGNATTISGIGLTATATGTATTRTVATTNLNTSLRRLGYVSAATAGSSAGVRSNALQFYRGNAAGRGGFFCVFRFSFPAAVAQQRFFVGLYGTAAAIGNVDPSTLLNCVGIGTNAAGATINLINNDGTAGAVVTGLSGSGGTFPALTTDAVYDFRIFCPPNGSTIYWSLERLDSANFQEGSLTTRIPASTTLLAPQIWVNNGTTASAASIDLINTYVETDN